MPKIVAQWTPEPWRVSTGEYQRNDKVATIDGSDDGSSAVANVFGFGWDKDKNAERIAARSHILPNAEDPAGDVKRLVEVMRSAECFCPVGTQDAIRAALAPWDGKGEA